LGPCWLRDEDGPHIESKELCHDASDDASDDHEDDDVTSQTAPSTEEGEEDDPTFRRRLYCEVGSDGQKRRIWRCSPEWIVRRCLHLSYSSVLTA
jgi:hypothetical protein